MPASALCSAQCLECDLHCESAETAKTLLPVPSPYVQLSVEARDAAGRRLGWGEGRRRASTLRPRLSGDLRRPVHDVNRHGRYAVVGRRRARRAPCWILPRRIRRLRRLRRLRRRRASWAKISHGHLPPPQLQLHLKVVGHHRHLELIERRPTGGVEPLQQRHAARPLSRGVRHHSHVGGGHEHISHLDLLPGHATLATYRDPEQAVRSLVEPEPRHVHALAAVQRHLQRSEGGALLLLLIPLLPLVYSRWRRC
mmetsp:Transcript_14091/g.23119  ORF Transcript_14091/g.23119 Transcript_14091/m.23119 type:complete len:254 (-) Transcript_14091:780-1541(-)